MTQTVLTQDDFDNYGEELVGVAKRAAQDAMRPELDALRQELLSKLTDAVSEKIGVASASPGMITAEDLNDYGEELVGMAKRAAQDAMRPELNALREEILSEFLAAVNNSSRPQRESTAARVKECGSSDLKTTVMFTGLATSFSKDGIFYTVSTIYRKDLRGLYQTSILKHLPDALETVYRIENVSQLVSVGEHVDAARMALTRPESTWEGTKDYQDDLMNEFSGERNGRTRPPEMSWTDRRVKMLITAADINYEPGFFSRFFSGWAA